MSVFDVDEFVAQCQAAKQETEPRRAIREVLDRALADPTAIGEALKPEEGGITPLFVSDDLTVLHVVWAPKMRLFPHEHRMWAAIGIYTGQEDNAFYRRSAPGAAPIVESGGKRLAEGDSVLLGDETIHAITNPRDQLTGAIHIYGGDFFTKPRSNWPVDLSDEQPHDVELLRRQFAEANAAWRASQN